MKYDIGRIRMKSKAITGLVLTLFLIGMLKLAFNIQPAKAEPRTIVVPDEYAKIQWAVDNASAGDTVYVKAGTYYEHVLVDKSVSLIGENKNNTIIDGNGTGHVVNITADNITITEFTIRNSGQSEPDSGIYVYGSKYSNISNNILTNNYIGINIENSGNNTIIGNTVNLNSVDGIKIKFSENNTLIGNIASSNNIHGIYIGYSYDNILSHNNASNNKFGILLDVSENNFIIGNTATNNKYNFGVYGPSDFNNYVDTSNLVDGKPIYYLIDMVNAVIDPQTNAGTIYLINCNNITIKDLTLTKNIHGIFFFNTKNSKIESITASNNQYGIELDSSSNNTLVGNVALNNDEGFWLADSNYNSIVCNTVSNNVDGMCLFSSNSNVFFHNNFISNTFLQMNIGHAPICWNNSFEGNYWSDYGGTDTNQDGIGDVPYIIDENNADKHPLMGMFSDFNTTLEYHVQTICNSTISDFQFNGTAICFNVSGENGTVGFCRICIPTALMNDTYKVFVNGTEVPYTLLPCSNNTHSYLYFTYNHSTREVVIVSELPDTTPPTISIASPENKTYLVNDVLLNFTVSESTSWIGYSLDGQTNVTIAGNITLSDLSEGSHHIVVYANDTVGNVGASSTVYFTIDTMPPNIMDVSQTPPKNNVLPEDEVKVNATITDYVSGVKQVILNYTNGNGTWITIDMTNLEGNIWNATIPPFPYCTNITYVIIAEDNANNTITTEEMEYDTQYHVISEYSTLTSILLILLLLTVAIATYKRRLLKTPIH